MKVRVLLLGMFVSLVGDNMVAVALSLQAADRNSSWLLAAILIAQSLPAVVVGFVAGILVDRWLQWWWWPAALLLQAGLFAILLFSQAAAVTVACVAVASAANSVAAPIANKMVSRLSDSPSATGRGLATVNGLAQAGGTALGGLVFGLRGIRPSLLVNAASFLLLAIVTAWVCLGHRLEIDRRPVASGFLVGLTRLASQSVFGRAGLLLIGVTVLTTSVEGVVGVFVLRDHAFWSDPQVGLAWAVWGIGVVAGSQLKWAARFPTRPVLQVSALAMGFVFSMIALGLPSLAGGLFLYAVGGVGNGVFNAALVRAISGGVTEKEQGRAWSAFRALTTLCFLGGYVLGGLAGQRHSMSALLASGLTTILGAGIGAVVGGKIKGAERPGL